MRLYLNSIIYSGLILSILFTVAPSISQSADRCSNLFSDSIHQTSRTLRLFNDSGMPVEKYHDYLKNLNVGDQLDFGNNSIFTFYGYLSDPRRGDLTTIIDIGHGRALRMSRHYYHTATHTPKMMADEMTDWFTVMDELSKNGVPVVKVFQKESKPPQFIVVKKENFLFRLSDLFEKGQLSLKNPMLQNIDPRIVQDALDKLVNFAKKTWMYENIGDFRYEQMGFNGQDWILFDVGIKHHKSLANFDEKYHIFSSKSLDPYSGSDLGNFLPKKIRQYITEVIKKQRAAAQKNNSWITRASNSTDFGFSNYLFDGITKEPLETGRVFRVKSGNPNLSTGPKYILDFWVEGRVTFKIISFIKRTDRYSSYQVQLKNGTEAILKVLQWNSDENLDKLLSKVLKLKKNNDPDLIAFGTDFVLMRR